MPTSAIVSLRVQKTLKARIATIAAQNASSESEVCRFLINKALADLGVDALAPLGMGVAK